MRRLVCVLTLIGLVAAAWAAAPAYAGEPICEIKWSTVAVPTQPAYKATEVLGKNVEVLSGGKIKVRTFHSGQLGDHQNPDRRTPPKSKFPPTAVPTLKGRSNGTC